MAISEQSTFDGRNLTLTWHESRQIPEGKNISQVSAFCLNDGGQVLIIKNKHGWGLPGGHPERGETVEQALKREIKEEADCTISDFALLGYIEVNDPDNESIEGKGYFQLRFLCRLEEVGEFNAEFETSERKFVAADALSDHVAWMASSITGKAQFETFLNSLD